MMFDINATWGGWHALDPSENATRNPEFLILLETQDPDKPPTSEIAKLITGILQLVDPTVDLTSNGTYVETKCSYVSAILQYDLEVNGTEVIILDSRPVAAANNTRSYSFLLPEGETTPVTMDAITMNLNTYVDVNASVVMSVPPQPGSFWLNDPTPQSSAVQLLKYLDFDDGNSIHIADPTSDIIKTFNELMFRAGVKSTHMANVTSLIDPGLSIAQTLHAIQSNTENVYRSDLRWWAGAAVLEALAILFVLPLFNGFWRLDKIGSLSPIQMALAFDAPLLKEANSAAGAHAAVNQLGDVRVKYGAVSNAEASDAKGEGDGNGTYRLGIAEIEKVADPPQGMRFDV